MAIYSLPRLLNEIRRTYEEGSDSSYLQLLDRLAEVDLLHVDDLGAEKSSAWVLEQLYAIVNARYEGERSITITTNILDREALLWLEAERLRRSGTERDGRLPRQREDRADDEIFVGVAHE